MDVLHEDQKICFIFEYLEMEVLNLSGELSQDPLLIKFFMYQILSGISYCHSNKVILEDLKLQCMLIDRSTNILKLADIGLSTTFCHEASTYWYRPPEVLRFHDHTPSGDIWAVGCCFAELVSGCQLFYENYGGKDLEKHYGCLDSPEDALARVSSTLMCFSSLVFLSQCLSSVIEKLERDGVELLLMMLCLRREERIAAGVAVKDKYFKDIAVSLNYRRRKEGTELSTIRDNFASYLCTDNVSRARLELDNELIAEKIASLPAHLILHDQLVRGHPAPQVRDHAAPKVFFCCLAKQSVKSAILICQ